MTHRLVSIDFFSSTGSALLAASALVLAGTVASAQSRSGPVFTRYNRPLPSVTLDLGTGTISRGPRVTDRKGTTVFDFDNIDLGGFIGVDSGNGFCRWIEAAVKGGCAVNDSDLMSNIVFAYCSSKLTPGSGGPGGSVGLQFYEGYTVFGGAPTTGVAFLTLTGLPANTVSSSFFGSFKCFFLRVIFGQLVCFADGPIGYSFVFLDSGTGVINPQGAVFAGTWPFLACASSCSGASSTPCDGVDNLIDQYCPQNVLRATFSFGTTSGAFTSVSMAIGEVRDQTATIASQPGIPAAPDVLTATPAIAGASWTATVTSGFSRTKTGSWTLFFGNTGVALPSGFDIGQFPKGGGNFGTSKGGRRLLCNFNPANPSGCASVPLPAGLGSASSCSATIPKKIGLVCNAWCGQAIVVGAVPAGASGGGNSRLTNSVSGILGTN